MDRSELYALDTYKVEEMKVKLQPITDWNEVKQGTEIWKEDIRFSYKRYSIFEEIVEEGIIKHTPFSRSVTDSSKGWYYYDEYIAKEIDELWTPKLWEVCDHREAYQCDRWLFIACNEQHLLSCWNEEQRDNLTYEEFTEQYNLYCIDKVSGFEIEVK